MPKRWALSAIPASVARTWASIFREYVCPETVYDPSKPNASATSRSRASTLASSPPKSARKLACVPVVPLTPSNFSSVSLRSISPRSRTSSWHHSERPFAHGDQLGRLEMGVAQAGQILPGLGKRSQRIDRGDGLVADNSQRRAHQDQIGVIRDVTARRSQVDDRAGQGSGIAQGVNVRHHVVAKPPFVGLCRLEVDRVRL